MPLLGSNKLAVDGWRGAELVEFTTCENLSGANSTACSPTTLKRIPPTTRKTPVVRI